MEEYRPDITKELDIEDCTEIVGLGRDIAALLSATSAQSRIETLGTTPIVSKQCDPSCLVSYVAGLVRLMKTFEQATEVVKYYFPVLRRFIDADCVDRGVITEIIDFGLNSITDQESWASAVCEMSYGMVHQLSKAYGTLKLLSDSRVAVAIRAGLVRCA